MSLLNDALRNAEQRQKGSGPAAPGVYTGAAAQSGQRSRWPLVVVILLLVALLLALGAWRWQAGSGKASLSALDDAGPGEVAGQVQRVSVPPETAAEPVPEADPEEVTQEPPAREPVIAPEPAPEQGQEEQEKEKQKQTVATAQTVQAEPAPQDLGAEPEPQPETAPSRAVKQTGQSPAARDREASRQIRDLLAAGKTSGAMDRLKQITAQQDAPLSRRAMVRHLLSNNQAEAALEWVPASVAESDSELRLLRARALLSVGQPEQALVTLTSRVPSIADHAAYRVTLATVLQQQGRYSDAANQWGALIAWDDSRAPWWAGLAMTLEAQGNHPSAVRAYRQAASLPGLSAELADYVRQRLQALQAG